MKIVSYSANGGPEILSYGDAPDPVPGPGEMLIQVQAIAIEGGDLLNRFMIPPPSTPHVVGYSAAGEILELGEGVEGFRLGQKVTTFGETGSHASLRAVRADQAWTVPQGLDQAAAATVPVAFGTAQEALFGHGLVKAGQTVLIQGAAGGVGLAAIQLAKQSGARVIGTGSSRSQLDDLRQYGLDEGIDYTTENLLEKVQALTGGSGVDMALDSVGGPLFQQVVSSVREQGRIVLVGGSGRARTMFDAVHIVLGSKRLSGFMLSRFFHEARVRDDIDMLLNRMARGDLVAVIDATYPLAAAREAHLRAEQRGRIGRVIMTP